MTLEQAFVRIEQLEARNRDLVMQCDTHARQKMTLKNRVEQLEAALREIDRRVIHAKDTAAIRLQQIARAALAPEPPRQENNDVFPGFRGNNDYG